MRRIYYLFFLLSVLLATSCTPEDKYPTSIVQDYELYLNGERWFLNTGITNRPIFIYDKNGEFYANYSPHYKFVLDNGDYNFFATPNPADLLPDSTRTVNLNDLVIQQPKLANVEVQISKNVKYGLPNSQILKMDMVNRTGILRLKAKDLTSDNSYSAVRAYVTVQRSGYNVKDESFVESELTVSRSKNTTTGGMNYTDDFIIFETKDAQHGATIKLDMLDTAGEVVKSLSVDSIYQVVPGTITIAEFYLNAN